MQATHTYADSTANTIAIPDPPVAKEGISEHTVQSKCDILHTACRAHGSTADVRAYVHK